MSPLLQQPQSLNRTCAWMLLGLSVLALGWSSVQLLIALCVDQHAVQQWLADRQLVAIGLPRWILSHATAISAWQLLSCLPCLALAAGMLGLRQWARTGLIALLLLSIPLNLAAMVLSDRLLVDTLLPLLAAGPEAIEAAHDRRLLLQSRVMLWVSGGLPTLALCAIHGWLAWRFDRADMRQLYRRQPPAHWPSRRHRLKWRP